MPSTSHRTGASPPLSSTGAARRRLVAAAGACALVPAAARARPIRGQPGVLAGGHIVHSFDTDGNPEGGGDPTGGLVAGPDGLPWGVAGGGLLGGGIVYRLVDGNRIEPMHAFEAGSHETGSGPLGELELASDGALYGATYSGGSDLSGTLYRIDGTGAFTQLHMFRMLEAYSPLAGVVQASDGAFYGTTSRGPFVAGRTEGTGCTYRLDADGTFTTLHGFAPVHDGTWPIAPLMQASDGLLYGALSFHGPNRYGSIFRMSLAGDFEVIHAFSTRGANPEGGLVEAPDGWLYGTTFGDGFDGGGTIYRLLPATGRVQIVHEFPLPGEPGTPCSTGLTLASDGCFYGMTGIVDVLPMPPGSVFRLAPGGRVTTLGLVPAQWGPAGPLYEATPGVLLGVTGRGGAHDQGCIFSIP